MRSGPRMTADRAHEPGQVRERAVTANETRRCRTAAAPAIQSPAATTLSPGQRQPGSKEQPPGRVRAVSGTGCSPSRTAAARRRRPAQTWLRRCKGKYAGVRQGARRYNPQICRRRWRRADGSAETHHAGPRNAADDQSPSHWFSDGNPAAARRRGAQPETRCAEAAARRTGRKIEPARPAARFADKLGRPPGYHPPLRRRHPGD